MGLLLTFILVINQANATASNWAFVLFAFQKVYSLSQVHYVVNKITAYIHYKAHLNTYTVVQQNVIY